MQNNIINPTPFKLCIPASAILCSGIRLTKKRHGIKKEDRVFLTSNYNVPKNQIAQPFANSTCIVKTTTHTLTPAWNFTIPSIATPIMYSAIPLSTNNNNNNNTSMLNSTATPPQINVLSEPSSNTTHQSKKHKK